MSKGPGKWQRAILAQLAKTESFPLLEFIRVELGREPTVSEYNSTYRAARSLEAPERGLCRLVKASGAEVTHPQDARPDGWLPRRFRTRPDGTLAGTAHTQPQVVVYRPGTGPAVNVEIRSVVTDGQVADSQIRVRLAGDIAARFMGEDAVTDRVVYAEWLAGTWENGDPLAAEPGSPKYLAEQAEYDAKMAAADEALCPHCDDWLVITEVASGEHQRLCERCQINWADPAQVAAYEAAWDVAYELRNPVLEPVLHDYADDLSPTTPTL